MLGELLNRCLGNFSVARKNWLFRHSGHWRGRRMSVQAPKENLDESIIILPMAWCLFTAGSKTVPAPP